MTLARAEWTKLVRDWRVSGQSARRFAAEHGVTDASLRYWATQLADQEDESVPPRRPRAPKPAGTVTVTSSPTLARVVRPGEAPASSGRGQIRVAVGKALIVVEPDFDADHLRAVVRALEEVG